MPSKKLKPRADGRYQKSITDERSGKRMFFYGSSEREVNLKILNYNEKLAKGKSFKEIADDWWEYEVEQLSPSTIRGYKCATERIVNHFREYRITDITASDINKFLFSLARKGYAKKTVKNHKIIVNRIFHFAVVMGEISHNPANDVELPRNLPETKRHPATVIEEGIIRKSSDVWLLPFLALATGMRKGELIGLRWEDVDLENNMINVKRSVWYGHGTNIKAPKTEAGIRKIPIIAPLREELEKRKGAPHHYVFGGEQPLSEKAYRHRYKMFQRATGITATAQQLRKSYATISAGANISPDVLKAIFGHKDISTTFNLYAEVRDYRISEAGALLEQHFKK